MFSRPPRSPLHWQGKEQPSPTNAMTKLCCLLGSLDVKLNIRHRAGKL